jgi:uncharacterized protein YkwD
MMKRLLIFLLVVAVLAVSLISCGDDEVTTNSNYTNGNGDYINDIDTDENDDNDIYTPSDNVDEPPYEPQTPDEPTDGNGDPGNGNDDTNDIPPQENPSDTAPPITRIPSQTSGNNQGSGNNDRPVTSVTLPPPQNVQPPIPQSPTIVYPTLVQMWSGNGQTFNETLDTGDSLNLAIAFAPANTSNEMRIISWESSDINVLSVQSIETNQARITAMNEGIATISGVTPNGLVATVVINVSAPVPAMTLDQAVRANMNYTEIRAMFPNADIQTAFEMEVVRLVNNIRVERGLPKLIYHVDLARIARLRAEESREVGVAHVSPTTGLSHTEHARAMGLNTSFAAENTGGSRLPSRVVDGWMSSDGHRRFILSGEIDNPFGDLPYIGVGFCPDINVFQLWLMRP